MASTQSTSLTSFIPLNKIGEGAFSSVYRVKRVTDQKIYALKKIKINSLKQKQKENALNEVRILASITSHYIITYKQTFFDQKLNLLCIVMEWASKHLHLQLDQGDLFKMVQDQKPKRTGLPEAEIWKAAYQIISGLNVLHKANILHRDLKSANIFVADGVYKLGDLNVSKITEAQQSLAKTQTGTPYYASPEIWRDEAYGSKSDIWSFGCILYEMCALRPPFKGEDLNELYKSVQKGEIDPIAKNYSKQLKQLIKACLMQNAKNRPSAEQLLNNTGELLRKCDYYGIEIGEVESSNDLKNKSNLISTIRMPMNIKDLKHNLPSSKYQSKQPQQQSLNNQSTVSMGKKNQSTDSSEAKDAFLKNRQKTEFKESKVDSVCNPIKTEALPPKEDKAIPLPQRIKYHLSQINRNSQERMSNVRRIQSSKNHRPLPTTLLSEERQKLNRKIDDYCTPNKQLPQSIFDIKKRRPLSCNQHQKSIESNQILQSLVGVNPNRNAYRLDKLSRGGDSSLPLNKARPIFNSDRKIPTGKEVYFHNHENYSSDRKTPFQMQQDRLSRYMLAPPSYLKEQRQKQKLRCRSANIKLLSYDQQPSSIVDLRKRLQMRGQNRPLSGIKPFYQNINNSKNQQKSGCQIIQKIKHQIRSDRNIKKDQFKGRILSQASELKDLRANIVPRGKQIIHRVERRMNNQSYLSEIQNKIINSSLVSRVGKERDSNRISKQVNVNSECRMKRIIKGSYLLRGSQKNI